MYQMRDAGKTGASSDLVCMPRALATVMSPASPHCHHHQAILWGRHLCDAAWETSLTLFPFPAGPMCDLLWSDPQPQVSWVSGCGYGLSGGVETGHQSPRVSCFLVPTRTGALSASGV